MIHYTTEVDIAGIIVRDPVTAITNLGIFAFGVRYFRLLTKHDLEYPNKNWNYFFLFIGLSSLLGIFVHGLSYYMSPNFHFHLWWLMGVVQSAGVSFAQFGVGSNVFEKRRSLVGIIVFVQFVAFSAIMYGTGSFEVAKIHIALGLIPIMIYYVFQGMKGLKAEILVATGIGVSALTAVVHSLKLSLSAWFNYNDIAHLLIITSLIVMYQGVKAGLALRKFA